MPNTRRLFATVLSTLSFATLAATADPGAASASRRERASCTGSAARSARRARGARHACKVKPRPSRARVRRRRRSQAPKPTIPATTTPAAAAANGAATIASVLATPCQNTELTPEEGNITLIRAAVLCLINRKRAENNEDPLIASAQLEQAAEGHCQELIADDYFAHVSPGGETPVDRIRTTGYIPGPDDGYVIGENLAWGTYQLSTPQAIVSAWIASPGHLANILEGQYRETGIGITPTVPASLSGGSPGATYAQEFGVIIR